MPKKFYAVRKGNKTGIFDSWPECQKQIKGFSGAEYKSFKTLDEAKAFMNLRTSATSGNENPYDDLGEQVHAYVDGSYDNNTKRFSSGVAIVYKQELLDEISQAFDIEALVSMRNVAGEIMGAILAMKWFEKNMDRIGVSRLIIYHDYEGIAKWPMKLWKAKKDGTRDYVETYERYRKLFEIEFVKVRAHNGNRYNEKADALAKEALGLGG